MHEIKCNLKEYDRIHEGELVVASSTNPNTRQQDFWLHRIVYWSTRVHCLRVQSDSTLVLYIFHGLTFRTYLKMVRSALLRKFQY